MIEKIKNKFKTKYRIVKDRYCGYTIEVKYWYSKWENAVFKGANTFSTVEEAEIQIHKIKNKLRDKHKSGVGYVGDVVKEVE
jgi:hypothetical protein